jgi:hypothetical protein
VKINVLLIQTVATKNAILVMPIALISLAKERINALLTLIVKVIVPARRGFA